MGRQVKYNLYATKRCERRKEVESQKICNSKKFFILLARGCGCCKLNCDIVLPKNGEGAFMLTNLYIDGTCPVLYSRFLDFAVNVIFVIDFAFTSIHFIFPNSPT